MCHVTAQNGYVLPGRTLTCPPGITGAHRTLRALIEPVLNRTRRTEVGDNTKESVTRLRGHDSEGRPYRTSVRPPWRSKAKAKYRSTCKGTSGISRHAGENPAKVGFGRLSRCNSDESQAWPCGLGTTFPVRVQAVVSGFCVLYIRERRVRVSGRCLFFTEPALRRAAYSATDDSTDDFDSSAARSNARSAHSYPATIAPLSERSGYCASEAIPA